VAAAAALRIAAVAKGILVVESGPSDPSREDEYNAWYDGPHMADVCAVPGFVGCRRYKLRGAPTPTYLAVYELEADDLDAPVAELRARSAAGHIARSDALATDPPPTVRLYELRG
jgi:hypothetical protein